MQGYVAWVSRAGVQSHSFRLMVVRLCVFTKFKLARAVHKPTRVTTVFIFVFVAFKSKGVCPVNSGLVPELPSAPQEAREPQPHLQHPHDLTAAQPPVPAHPDPRGAAVHSLRRPGGIDALGTTLVHRQWAPTFSWCFVLGLLRRFIILNGLP